MRQELGDLHGGGWVERASKTLLGDIDNSPSRTPILLSQLLGQSHGTAFGALKLNDFCSLMLILFHSLAVDYSWMSVPHLGRFAVASPPRCF
jgi:hypothetical protein